MADAPPPSRILVAEDEPDIRDLLVAALERVLPQAEVRQARDGREALEMVAAGPVDFLVTDLRMPRLDGEALLGGLDGRAAKILVVTAFGDDATRQRVADLGANDVLVKPFGYEEFLAAVRRVLGLRT